VSAPPSPDAPADRADAAADATEAAGCAHPAASYLEGTPILDPEGTSVPAGVARVVDAHVHLFPPAVFEAIWRWFDQHAWHVRYRLHAEQVVDFQRARGVARIVALHYAHKPGMARWLNGWIADLARAHPGFVVPLGTVLPGEPDADAIVAEALGPLGLHGLKLHCHVQRMPADDPRIEPVYAACEAAGRPVVIHAGREPSLAAYGVDTRALCGADQVARVLERHPKLALVVPHLGADEYEAYGALLERFENLWLDTTMAIGGFLAPGPPRALFPARAERLLYGTDFPNVPYAWDRELRTVLAAGLPPDARDALLAGNALRLFDPP
jgi:predicted TIM-barrel fold metal-dependent hydrolase